MKYKIVVDSSVDLDDDYIKDEKIGFEIVPLTIEANNKSFVDNRNLNIDEMLEAVHASKEKPKTACPSCGYFTKSYKEAEYVICITISSKLSGTYNAAYLGGKDCESKVHVIDSKGTSGTMRLLVDRAYQLMKEDLPFEEICEKLEKYRDEITLFFVLDSFDNLVKNGRMSKITAFIATALYIKPLCKGVDGSIEVYEKPRTLKGAFKRLVESIGKECSNSEDRECVITHCKNLEGATYLKEEIEKSYKFKKVVVKEMKGLCSFYALEKGVIVSF